MYRVFRSTRGISKLSLLILLLAAVSIGAVLSYMWTVAYYVELGLRVPEGVTTITITNVTFPLQDSTFFEVSVLNPSYSEADANIATIALVSGAEMAEIALNVPPESAEPTIPYPLSKGEDVTFRCNVNWQDLAGETVYVVVLLQDDSGATFPYETSRVKLLIPQVQFVTAVTVKEFNISVANSIESSIPLNISEILFDSIEIPPENITIAGEADVLPIQIEPGRRETFTVKWDLFEQGALNASHDITVKTLQGYSATYNTPTLPPAPTLSITNVTFAIPHTNKFEMTVTNLASSPHRVDLSRAIVLNGTDRFDVAILGNPQLILMPGENVTLQCSWNWEAFEGQEVTIRAYTTQGIYKDAHIVVETSGRPVATFEYSPTAPYTNDTVTLDARKSYDTYGTIINYFWDFGDGTNGTGEITSHTYMTKGDYVAKLNVTDDDGLTDSTSANITVLNRAPIASFTESETAVLTNQTIEFNASESFDLDGTIVDYSWDFGDGANASGAIAQHAYIDDGNYTVTLTVTDNDGETGTSSAVKTVSNRLPVGSFTESATTVYTAETVSFNASSSFDPDGVVVSYFWDFGDGANATGDAVSHAYVDDGNYTVILAVTDDDGATASANTTIIVVNRLPSAGFTESVANVTVGQPIDFNASSSYDPDGFITSFFWDFGDGSNATGINVTHAYTTSGVFVVTLTITDNDGAMASANATMTVSSGLVITSLSESPPDVHPSDRYEQQITEWKRFKLRAPDDAIASLLLAP